MIGEHINGVMALLERIDAGNLEDKLQKQLTQLRNEFMDVEAKIDRNRFYIRNIAPTMAEGLLTKGEANELRARYEAEQGVLEKKQSGILEQIRQIEDGTLLECHWAKQFEPYFGHTSFSRKDIAMLIEAIFLHRDKRIEIYFVHDQEYQYIRQMME